MQILEITVEFSGLFTELDPIDRLAVAPAFSLHRHLCSSGHAGIDFTRCIFFPTQSDILIWILFCKTQVFGGRFNFSDEEEKTRHNFDSFWQSLLTVFQVFNYIRGKYREF